MSTPLRSEIEIDASPDRVWNVLTDFAAYPDWNPFIRRLDGQFTVGSRLTTRIEPPGGMGMTLRPTVLAAVSAASCAGWAIWASPACSTASTTSASNRSGRSVSASSRRSASPGMLAPLVLRFIEQSTRQGFKEMNEALKTRAERPASPGQ